MSGNRKPKALVIEDNEIDRKIINKVLSKTCELLITNSGEEALRIAREESPNIILLDLNLPDMNGMDLCRTLKGDPQTEPIPVIFLTAEDKPTMMVEAFEMDAENYLTKPINPKVLLNQVTDVLEEQEQELDS